MSRQFNAQINIAGPGLTGPLFLVRRVCRNVVAVNITADGIIQNSSGASSHQQQSTIFRYFPSLSPFQSTVFTYGPTYLLRCMDLRAFFGTVFVQKVFHGRMNNLVVIKI